VDGHYPNRYDYFDSAGSRERKWMVTTQTGMIFLIPRVVENKNGWSLPRRVMV